ncbi:SDR family NAD(P)-dependent oxidoreductase [Williamsia sp. D3]|uniref:SDR family NAD(P)-dependent oxidoreductase n=1 Tax=Williamsia sp. D3 TaxID=1313067 RepID=UPI0003D38002|nr:SDR family oxidoreductase [Williamsia sp. D3]ETD33292.1 3-oxoacyl-ACP reductase [Williamsia sp. D3]
MSFSIEGKKILITGGARGIGGESARHFARQGAHVVTLDTRDEEGTQLAKEATEAGPGKVTYRHMDITKVADIRAGVDAAVDELGGLDAVFNAAEVMLLKPAEDTTLDDWNEQLNTNAKGTAYTCQAVFPHLKERGGSIVNLSAGVALTAGPINSASFSASKGSIISYTRTIALEWAQFGIRCNCVSPLVKTPLLDEVRAAMSDDDRVAHERFFEKSVPLGRLGDIDTDLAPVFVFLASDASKFITSQIIGVDGGLVPSR